MRNLPLLSLAIIFSLLACENEADSQFNQPSYAYDTSQQYVTTESFIIDFEEFNPGDIVSEIMFIDPFNEAAVNGITMAFPNDNAAMIFDSSNPTGGDFDIGTPNELYGGPGVGNGGASNDTALGNVLILSEDLDSNDPDDIFEVGARFVFDFSANENVTLNGFDILDIEESNNPTVVSLFDSNNVLLLSEEITPGGDNSKTYVDLMNTGNVAYMEIAMNSSGAVDNIALELETEEPCVECDSSIVELTLKYIGSFPEANIRFETTTGDIIFDELVQLDEEFTITGNAGDGSFSSELLIFVNDQQVDQLITDCSQVIGPGFFLDSLEVIAGTTLSGGQLCPIQIFF
ncbi:hypothetical protein [Winogradskyella tangerina]|uniref:hypothetical protein n=1 Tax=Winogradskyella tangerina TaxID=2023240 RepID=UPI0013001ED4|nr:hypothetical protein [Winogradskyella tangerina]